MQKFLKWNNLGNLKIMLTISIICGKFLAISIGDTIRLSLENLTIILSGILFGPVVGGFTGLIADIVGCILRGYAINPILTAAAVFIGFFSGVIYHLLKNFNSHFRILSVVVFCHTVGSVIIKTIGLCVWFNYPFYPTLVGRIINYIIVAIVEFLILEILIKNKTLLKTIGGNNEL